MKTCSRMLSSDCPAGWQVLCRQEAADQAQQGDLRRDRNLPDGGLDTCPERSWRQLAPMMCTWKPAVPHHSHSNVPADVLHPGGQRQHPVGKRWPLHSQRLHSKPGSFAVPDARTVSHRLWLILSMLPLHLLWQRPQHIMAHRLLLAGAECRHRRLQAARHRPRVPAVPGEPCVKAKAQQHGPFAECHSLFTKAGRCSCSRRAASRLDGVPQLAAHQELLQADHPPAIMQALGAVSAAMWTKAHALAHQQPKL